MVKGPRARTRKPEVTVVALVLLLEVVKLLVLSHIRNVAIGVVTVVAKMDEISSRVPLAGF